MAFNMGQHKDEAFGGSQFNQLDRVVYVHRLPGRINTQYSSHHGPTLRAVLVVFTAILENHVYPTLCRSGDQRHVDTAVRANGLAEDGLQNLRADLLPRGGSGGYGSGSAAPDAHAARLEMRSDWR